ncbi:style cell-cycle inhibitor 1 isoform X1 [Rhodamnia argentea]|uniref:Style cell-cycle inhibitor 1 isoform X1 n=1 Tax=Rhodamnia argentea TaxID=178133 RepID=A0A8B8NZA4_9MYRT|nr:style cell-cycle inhibitor 1 isoform X1 [Rhodamnia argentea]
MESERRSKDEKKSQDGRTRKRHRSEEGDENESRKSDKKEKGKDRKSHKHRSDKEKKSRDSKGKHKSKDRHSHLKHDIQELSNDDYFLKNNEFATWLKEERNVFFSDLSAESARELFSEFIKEWNRGKLESRYYEGIASGRRTAHDWKIKV